MKHPSWELKPAVPLDRLPLDKIPDDAKPLFAELLQQPTFIEAKTEREQVGFACSFLRETPGRPPVSFAKIAALFSLNKGSASRHYERSKTTPMPPGRARILPEEGFTYIRNTLSACLEQHTACTYQMLLDGLQQELNISVKLDTLRKICRKIPGVQIISGDSPPSSPDIAAAEDEPVLYITRAGPARSPQPKCRKEDKNDHYPYARGWSYPIISAEVGYAPKATLILGIGSRIAAMCPAASGRNACARRRLPNALAWIDANRELMTEDLLRRLVQDAQKEPSEAGQ
jgi:hypothetical protein